MKVVLHRPFAIGRVRRTATKLAVLGRFLRRSGVVSGVGFDARGTGRACGAGLATRDGGERLEGADDGGFEDGGADGLEEGIWKSVSY